MKKTTILLEEKDTAIVLRDNGKSELYLRTISRDSKTIPSDNELLAFVLSQLLKDRNWVEEQIQLYEKRKTGGMK